MIDCKISWFSNCFDTKKPVHKPLQEILKLIREPDKATREKIDAIRRNENKEQRNKLKNDLPVYTFAGTFRERRNEGIENYSGIVVIDFDGIEALEGLKARVCRDSYTFAAFVSPSGRGLKVLVQTNNTDPKLHRRYAEAVQEHYNQYAPVDPQGSGLCMGAYASHDPEMYLDNHADEWDTPKEEVTQYYTGYKDPGLEDDRFALHITGDNELFARAVEYISRFEIYTEGNRNKFVFRLAGQCNRLGISQTSAEQRISAAYGGKGGLSAGEIKACIKSGYSEKHRFGTVKLKDVDRYNTIRQMRQKGATKETIIEAVKEKKPNESAPVSESAVEKAIDEVDAETASGVATFWDTFQKDPDNPASPWQIKISNYKFTRWLEKLGVAVFYPLPDKTGDYMFVRVRNNVVVPIEQTFIQTQARGLLEKQPPIVDNVPRESIIEKFIAGIDSTTSAKKLSTINVADLEFHRDTKEAAFFYFRNGIVKVSRDDIHLLGYEQLDRYVWDGKIRRSIIVPPDNSDMKIEHYLTMGKGRFDFGDWIFKTAGEDMERAKAICGALGYLCHNYSDPANPRAVILLETPNGEGRAEGGTGKGILTQAVEQMRTVVKENGKLIDPTDKFWLQGLKPDTDVFCIDDINPNFNFENLFSILSEGIPVERKHLNKIYIPAEMSPKFLINTNKPLGSTGFSSDRRKYEIELTHHFKMKYGTPFEYYGRLFFRDDWSSSEWQTFYYFMFECARYYFSLEGKFTPTTSIQLQLELFRQETSGQWLDFAARYIRVGAWYAKGVVKEKYISAHPKHNQISTQKVTEYFAKYAKYLGLKFEEGVKSNYRCYRICPPNEEEKGVVDLKKEALSSKTGVDFEQISGENYIPEVAASDRFPW